MPHTGYQADVHAELPELPDLSPLDGDLQIQSVDWVFVAAIAVSFSISIQLGAICFALVLSTGPNKTVYLTAYLLVSWSPPAVSFYCLLLLGRVA